MTTQIFGEVAWNDDLGGQDGKKFANSKDLFLRLDEGPNEIRLVTQPYQYLVHKFKKKAIPLVMGRRFYAQLLMEVAHFVLLAMKLSHVGY